MTAPRLAPHSIELEQALLGAILLNNDALKHVGALKPEHFYEPVHRAIYEAAAALIKAGKIADLRTIWQHLPPGAEKTRIGPITLKTYIGRLAAEAVTVLLAGQYAQSLAEIAGRRDIIRTAEDILAAAYDGCDDDIAEKARAAFGEIAKARANPDQIALTFFRDLAGQATPKLWLIKDVIARNEVSSWIGKPGGGKSALVTDISAHGAAGRDWRGYRTLEPFGVLYFALERRDLVLRRLQAHRLRDGLPDNLPVAVAGQIISLIDPRCVDLISDAISRAQDGFGREVGLAIIDTRSKGIAAGGGDEDKARFQNLAAAHLRCVIDRTGGRLHIASVGHTGKDPEKGERGSNATMGDIDVEVTISGDAIRTAKITKANDQPEVELTSYALESFVLGIDEDDGQPFGTSIVEQQPPDGTTSPQPKATQALNAKQKLAMEALTEVLLSDGQPAPTAYKLPASVRVVPANAWKNEIFRRDIFNGSKNPHSRFGETQTALHARHLIGVRDGLVWDARS